MGKPRRESESASERAGATGAARAAAPVVHTVSLLAVPAANDASEFAVVVRTPSRDEGPLDLGPMQSEPRAKARALVCGHCRNRLDPAQAARHFARCKEKQRNDARRGQPKPAPPEAPKGERESAPGDAMAHGRARFVGTFEGNRRKH